MRLIMPHKNKVAEGRTNRFFWWFIPGMTIILVILYNLPHDAIGDGVDAGVQNCRKVNPLMYPTVLTI